MHSLLHIITSIEQDHKLTIKQAEVTTIHIKIDLCSMLLQQAFQCRYHMSSFKAISYLIVEFV